MVAVLQSLSYAASFHTARLTSPPVVAAITVPLPCGKHGIMTCAKRLALGLEWLVVCGRLAKVYVALGAQGARQIASRQLATYQDKIV